MKKCHFFSRIGATLLSVCLVASMGHPALAVGAEKTSDSVIDMDAECSITLYKYDFTNASKDGVWDNSYVSTGVADANVEATLGQAEREGDYDGDNKTPMHNGYNTNGYAIMGVEFSYLRVADIWQYTESVVDGSASYTKTMLLYGFDKVKAAGLLEAIGLGNGVGRYVNADNSNADGYDPNCWYYESDVLNTALANALAANSTAVKNAMETYIAENLGDDPSVGGKMPLTSEEGRTEADGLKVGLYLLVETAVPETVTSTVAPFFLSLPMTSIDGSNATDGGQRWLYDVTVYPKNETGIVTLEKTVREAKADTGKHGDSGYGNTYITDGWEHNATGSAGDIMEYQILSTLPAITSAATNISEYTFHDVIADGLTYTKGDVVLEFFSDKACATEPVATWTENDDTKMFTVSYGDGTANEMYIEMTADGLAAINYKAEDSVNDKGNGIDGSPLYAGYSNYTLRVTYTAKIDSDKSFVYGDAANCNTVSLTWGRTSDEYYDMLWDDCHVYSYGLDITKLFAEKKDDAVTFIDSKQATADGWYDNVKFKIQNVTDGYYVVAQYNTEEGVYYVIGHTEDETLGTTFVPKTAYPATDKAAYGHIVVKGLEDDEYSATELETQNKFTLLTDDIRFTITVKDDESRPCSVYAEEAKLGVYQNDGHYYFEECPELPLANIPQKQLAHNFLTASGSVDGKTIVMNDDIDPEIGKTAASTNAILPLTVENTRGFNLPFTGEFSTLAITTLGTLAACGAGYLLLVLFFKRKKEQA